MRRSCALALMALGLGACSTGAEDFAEGPGTASRPPVVLPGAQDAPPAQTLNERGLDAIIGKDANTVLSRLGAPRIDLTEGDVRKLQFANQACVLDVFFYPNGAAARRIATHVEARLRTGVQTDRAQCLSALSG